MRTKQYAVAYIIRRGHTEWPHANVVEAANANQAREKFDKQYYSQPTDYGKPHPFHITVKRLDGLAVCPLCGTSMIWKGNAVECQRIRCGLKIKLPTESAE